MPHNEKMLIGNPQIGEFSLIELEDLLLNKGIEIKTRKLSLEQQWNILITGGAGFVGSHLTDRLMLLGHKVSVLDNLSTGSLDNIRHWLLNPNFQFIQEDIVELNINSLDDRGFSHIFHLACPASPLAYQHDPVKTVKTNVLGTLNALELARIHNALFLLASTSEIYGDPEKHPQDESYWGNVNPIGPRACYDEGKRIAETLTMEFHKCYGIDTRIARIFNTFGPRMGDTDGRVVSSFITQALSHKPFTFYGEGKQTRSFQYIYDLIDGLLMLCAKPYHLPINLGNPQEEISIEELARIIGEICGTQESLLINYESTAIDDPRRRKPDISKAREIMGWAPKFSLRAGLVHNIEYIKRKRL